MGTADLALVVLGGGSIRSEVSRVILAHVVLQRLTVGLWRGLPSRLLGGGVEVVWQVLAVGVADLPACGQACGLHGDEECQKRVKWQYEHETISLRDGTIRQPGRLTIFSESNLWGSVAASLSVTG